MRNRLWLRLEDESVLRRGCSIRDLAEKMKRKVWDVDRS